MAVNAYILTTKQVRARLDNYGGNIGKEPILLNSGEEGFQLIILFLIPSLALMLFLWKSMVLSAKFMGCAMAFVLLPCRMRCGQIK